MPDPPKIHEPAALQTHAPSARRPQMTTSTMAHKPKPLLTVREFHQEFQGAVGLNRLYGAVNEGRIRSLSVGQRKRLIPASEVLDWPNREMGHRA